MFEVFRDAFRKIILKIGFDVTQWAIGVCGLAVIGLGSLAVVKDHPIMGVTCIIAEMVCFSASSAVRENKAELKGFEDAVRLIALNSEIKITLHRDS